MTKKLTVNGVEYRLNAQQTLLENLETQSIPIEFHCRDGHCGACKCKLIRGDVRYTTTPLAYLREGEVLPCSCIGQSNIHLQID